VVTPSGAGSASAPAAPPGASEVEQLRRHVRDLAALLALPAMWRTAEPAQIVASLTEVLFGLMRLDLVYARVLEAADGHAIEDARPVAAGPASEVGARLIAAARSALPVVPNPVGDGHLRLACVVPGRHAQEWVVIAGASREDFPSPQERFLVQVAADQAALAVEKALLIAGERRARAEAEVANRAKSAFLASMSHELRTPLNAIGGYVELMEMGIRGPVTAEQAEDLARIRKSGRHLLSLINDVLNFAKIEAGHLDFALSDIPVDDVLEGVSDLVAPQLHARRIAYEHLRPADDLAVRADPERLRQVLLNLLSNAIKFTAPGGRVVLDASGSETEVRIAVSDTGCGIPADKLATVFDPFVQLHRSLSEPTEGAGLGLAISRELTRAMNGSLSVESSVGRGSTFVVTLPRATISPAARLAHAAHR
jgi:signal transduction histidine kinase